jgi:hypothetical protein
VTLEAPSYRNASARQRGAVRSDRSRRPEHLDVPRRLVVIPRGWICSVSGIEFAQDGVERAVIPLAQDFDPVTDQERSTDSLPRLVTALRPPTVIDHLGTAGSTGVHKQRQANVVLLRPSQHRLSGTEYPSRPIFPGIAKESGRPLENIKSGAAVDVWRGTRGPEREILGAKGEHMDIWKLQQAACVRVGSAVGRTVYAARHARKTGTHQELEGVLPSERGPRCDFRLAREMG